MILIINSLIKKNLSVAAEAKKRKIGDYKFVIRGLLFGVVFSNYLCVNSINSFLCGEKIYD